MAADSQSTPLSDYVQLTRQQWQQQLQLFSLEAQRAAESMTMIWVLGLFLALIMLSSWVIVLLLTAQALLIVGLTPWQTLSVLLLLQAVALWLCLRLIRYHSRFLGFPASVGHAHTHSKASGQHAAENDKPGGAPPSDSQPSDSNAAKAATMNAAMLSALAAEALFAVAPAAAAPATSVQVPATQATSASESLPCCDVRDAPAAAAQPAVRHCTKEAPCSPSNYR